MKFCVAIDGPAAAGKGSIAQTIADHFGFLHLDSGLLYRMVAHTISKKYATDDKKLIERYALQVAQSLDKNNLTANNVVLQALKSLKVSTMASKIAQFTTIRHALFKFQKDFCNCAGGAVIDGRDIGTVICPNADVKLFIKASTKERTKRRWTELRSQGNMVQMTEVLAAIKERDSIDKNRAIAPLRIAKDAIVLDTSHLTLPQAVQQAIAVITPRFEAAKLADNRA